MNIANQGFPATRADINNALQALASNNSGTSAPSTTFANQWWYDEANNKLYIRNEANNAWIQVAVLDQTNNEWQITTGVIQAKDGDGLALKTDDGTTRLFVKDDGKVGVGTSSPLQALSLFGTGAGNAVLQIEGEGGADPTINFLANNAQHWAIGIDDSDSDKFKISEHSALGTNDYLTVDVNGNVTMPSQPAFQVNKGNSTQANIAVNSDVLVTFNTETFDIGSNFASNTFTAPVTGKYVFSFLLRVDSVDIDSNYYIPFIETSNRRYRVIVDPNFSSDPAYFSFTLTCLADMDANDTCVIKINQGSGAAASDISGDPDYTWFTGYLAC